ncbi:MAG: DUF2155 domain-containing protein [Litoreibacter sp.]|nr:DUF2155 domain-containing protein [Litoreibacter sp.]
MTLKATAGLALSIYATTSLTVSAQNQIIETELGEPTVIETQLGEPTVIETEIIERPLDPIFDPNTVPSLSDVLPGVLPPETEVISETREPVERAEEALLRGLDKMSGESVDLPLSVGESTDLGRLNITLKECRYPTANPTGDAYAYLEIRDTRADTPFFEGWMIASSPALMALDHPRYDVWVIRCKFVGQTPSVVAGESSPRPLMRP